LLLLLFYILLSGSASEREKKTTEYVPLKTIVEYFNLDYKFNFTTDSVEIGNKENTLIFIIGTNSVITGEEIDYLKEKVYISDDIVMIPEDGVDLIVKKLSRKNINSYLIVNNFYTSLKKKDLSINKTADVRYKRDTQKKYNFNISTIIVDPGHGGKDPGGIGYNGIKEKEIVLKVAKYVEKELRGRYLNKKIIMTREEDEFVSLEKRSEISNNIDAEHNTIFISIHSNVSFKANSKGFETYFLSLEPENEEARDVASMENSVLNFEIQNYNEYLKEIINRIVDVEYRRESIKLATYIQDKLKENIGDESVDRGVKSAFFYVLKEVKMPSVLVEIGFVTNSDEAKRLLDKNYQKRVAKGIAEGIGEFITVFRETEGFTR